MQKYEEIKKQNEEKRSQLLGDYSAKSAKLQEEIEKAKNDVETAKQAKAKRLDEYDRQYAERLAQKKRELETVEEAVANNQSSIDEYNNQVLPQLETNKEGVETEIVNLRKKMELAEESSANLADMGDFGVAPTLQFLAKAAKDGNPEFGRKFAFMPDYKPTGFLSIFRGSNPGSSFQTRDDLNQAISSAIDASQAAYESYTKKAMSRGETAADYTGYVLSRQVARKAADEQAALPYLQMIADLLNIEATEIVHAERELSLLYGWLLPFSLRDFTVEKTEEAVEDYQYYIRAAVDRETIDNAIAFVKQRLEYARSLKKEFAAANLSDRLEAHIIWLENLLRALYERQQGDVDDSADDTEEGLLRELEDAIEDGNLVRKRKIEDLLKNLRDKKNAEVDGDGGGTTEPDSFGLAGLPVYELPKPEDEVWDLILESIDIAGYDPVPDIGKYRAVGGNLGKLAKALEKKGAGPEIIKQVKKAAADEKKGGGNTGGINLDPDPADAVNGDGNGQNGASSDTNSGGSGGDGNVGSSGGDTGSIRTGGGNTGSDDSNSVNEGSNGNSEDENGGSSGEVTDSRNSVSDNSNSGSGNGNDDSGNRSGNEDDEGISGRDVDESSAYDSGEEDDNGSGNRNTNGDDSGNRSGNSDDSLKTANLTRDDVEDAIENVTGKEIGDLTDDELAVVAASLDEIIEEYPSDNLSGMLDDLLDELIRDANSFVYRQYNGDGKNEYVSLASVDRCRRLTGFRYVHEESADKTTMSQFMGGSASYTFKIGSKDVVKNMGGKEKMTKNAVQQTDNYVWGNGSEIYTYIFEDDAKKYLDVTCRYIHGTEWAVLVTSGMDSKMKEIVSIIEEMIENAIS